MQLFMLSVAFTSAVMLLIVKSIFGDLHAFQIAMVVIGSTVGSIIGWFIPGRGKKDDVSSA